MKLRFSTLLLLFFSFAAGAGFMYWWNQMRAQDEFEKMQALFASKPVENAILNADLRDSQLAEGVQDPQAAESTPRSGAELPSQLSAINLEGVSEIYPVSAEETAPAEPAEKEPSAVDLSGVTGQVPTATDNAQSQMPSSITMIEVPVKARVISTIEQYKEFKRAARGSYPTTDFETEQVVVLESQSNFPDKVFEVAGVQESADKVVVFYRVNVFGLDQKTNTHSVVKIPKTALPVELKQVL